MTVSYEPVRRWCLQFGPMYQRTLKLSEANGADRWHFNEFSRRTIGEQIYLWHVVYHDGGVLDIMVQRRRTRIATEHFFRNILGRQAMARWSLPLTSKQATTGALKAFKLVISSSWPSRTL